MARKRLGDILIQAGVLDDAGLRAALSEQRRWGGPLGRILVEMNLLAEDVLVQALSHQLNFPVINLDVQSIHPDVLDLVPAEFAEQHSIVPFKREGKFLDVAMSDPTNLGIIDELRIRTQLNVRSYLAGPKALEKAISKFYGRGLAGINYGMGQPPSAGSGASVAGESTFDAPGAAELDAGSAVRPHMKNLEQNASSQRAAAFSLAEPAVPSQHGAEIRALQERISTLEALVARDEDVLRKVLGLLVEKGIASREEILERIK